MSLFRKPKKIQSRVFCADDDDDGDPGPPPPPIISVKKDKPAKAKSLLSFADEEEDDGEVFQVKKSSQSKRLAKRRDKEKRQPDTDNNKLDIDNHEEKHEPMEVDTVPPPKPKKKITLEGLILSGREALSAEGKGDVSSGSEGEEEEEDSRGFHRYRAESVRAALAGAAGIIPDAALIHAARKTRQQARELGGDYIPVKTESAPGSRLVRDDGSDDEEEGRLQVRGLELPSDKPKRGTAVATNEELDSEGEQWEEQQLQKAMPAIADIAGEMCSELNPFSLAPPAPRLDEAPAHLRSLVSPAGAPPSTAAELVAALSQRLQDLRTQQEPVALKREQNATRLHNTLRARDSFSAKCAQLDRNYKRAQAMRAYLTDLLECLDEKMPQLEALEGRALALHKRRCEFVVERRRADVRDQAQDVLAMAARPGAAKPVDSEEKRRRCAEREGRRRARRLQREANNTLVHREGDSSDDELPPQQEAAMQAERESIRQQAAHIFSDTQSAWHDVGAVCSALGRYRRRNTIMYCDAYLPDMLPKLIAPYVRQQLILWNPLADEDNEDYERMDWYKCLMMYGVRPKKVSSDTSDSELENGVDDPACASERAVREDIDLMLVPIVLNKVVLPKIAELLEHAWDPLSVRASIRLRSLIARAATQPGAAAGLRRVSTAAHATLTAALNADVFIPALPPQILEGSGGVFWRRCLGGGVRLLRSTLALTSPPALLRADPCVLALIETLSMALGAAPGPHMASAAAALSATLPRSGALRAAALRRLSALAALALSRLQTDNPLHLKALEQARALIAEAKAAKKESD